MKEKEVVVDTKKHAKDGQLKCPYCGASEIVPSSKSGKLRCNYCSSEFDGKKLEGMVEDIKELHGRVKGSGAKDIKKDANDVITLKCGGCGAEVVIDTANAPHARCHWCRSYLSINSQLENGAIPDVILPFQVKKEDAQSSIKKFVGARQFYAHPTFKKEFTTDNIMGVYFPYMLVDANCHANFQGEAEHLVRRYTMGDEKNSTTYYDADSYHVEREFDITVNGLEIESNSMRLDKTSNEQTNNIINAVMPFDTENCIEYHSNYLVGYTSERRDVNVDDLNDKVRRQLKDVAKFSMHEDMKFYDRGVHWDSQYFNVMGTQWLAAYLPVWLYSYQEDKGDKKVLHYVAVNARTGETMGSVPINTPLLLLVSGIIEILCGILGLILFFATYSEDDEDAPILFLLLFLGGFIYYGAMYAKYRNKSARHTYEKETKHEITNLRKVDQLVQHKKQLKNRYINDRNDDILDGEK
ncbi:MAG: TFIIB-type zinc ribbon-containing protein [Bacilli bacterium]|nr:TFIIB-type zinc ribbon-containing protein [Bacilli bacterium]